MPHGGFPSRRPPPDTQPAPQPHRHHASYASPPPPSQRAAPPPPPPARAWSDGALSILSSCGLEPGDLHLLAELPEEALTLESLPRLLQQIKGRKATPPSPAPPSPFSPAEGRLHPRGRPVGYSLEHMVRARAPAPPSPSSSSSSPAGRRHAPSESAKSGGGVRLWQRPASAVSRRPGEEQPHGAPPPGRTAAAAAAAVPSRKEAQDFHGLAPSVFPYSCSLCNITVLSDKNWEQHINGTHHADGQLKLLQRCPSWDCRLESARRAQVQWETWKGAGPPLPKPAANQKAEPPKEEQRKLSEKKSKVVCVKFPAQRVDEAHLRKLMEPFGKIVKILMFPSLAFVELGSFEQAHDLVKFHSSSPPTVNGQHIHFSISSTFNFLQSSQVVRFSPAPSGEHGKSDLLSVIKRFGMPLYTLFLPSQVFVEMEAASDAAKLVEFYSSKPLRINDDLIKVTFSGEYRSLMQVPSAQRYEDQTGTRSLSRDRSLQSSAPSSSNRDSQEASRRRDGRRRSSSSSSSSSNERTCSSSDTRPRKRSRETRSDERTRSGKRSRGSKSRSRSGDRRSRSGSESRDKPGDRVTSTREEEAPQKAGSTCEAPPVGRPQPQGQQRQDGSSEEESDLEGMEVIGEDLDDLEDHQDRDQEALQEAEEEDIITSHPQQVREEGKEEVREEVKEEVKEEQMQLEEEGEPSFPVDQDDLVTLDELHEDESDAEVTLFSEKAGGGGVARQLEMSNPLPFVHVSDNYCRLAPGLAVAQQGKASSSREEQSVSHADGRSTTCQEKEEEHQQESGTRQMRSAPEEDHAPHKRAETPHERSESSRTAHNPQAAADSNTWAPPSPQTPGRPGEEESAAPPEETPPPREADSAQSPRDPSRASPDHSALTQPQHTRAATAQQPALKSGEQQDAVGASAAGREPLKPVGAEFVRPVVGYFCHLCQLIYADEDEAKVRHCSSPQHYAKYQEQTGKDPWLS